MNYSWTRKLNTPKSPAVHVNFSNVDKHFTKMKLLCKCYSVFYEKSWFRCTIVIQVTSWCIQNISGYWASWLWIFYLIFILLFTGTFKSSTFEMTNLFRVAAKLSKSGHVKRNAQYLFAKFGFDFWGQIKI